MASTPVLVVLQARTGSSRLPGKVLRPLAGHSLLSHCVTRLRAAAVGPVVVATTTKAEDDGVVVEARRLDVPWFRGHPTDVLDRFVRVAALWNAGVVIRATADNPAVDIGGPARVLEWATDGADYVVETGLPVGAAVEMVTRPALEQAHRQATRADHREHVTLLIKEQPGGFRVAMPMAPEGLRCPELSLTVDTPADLAFMDRVLNTVPGRLQTASLASIVATAARLSRSLEVS